MLLEGDLAAEQPDQLAADRQAQPRAAVLAGRRAVGLGEGLEDAPLHLRRDADAGVGDAERHHRAARASVSFAGLQPLSARLTRTLTSPLLGELERVGEQVLQHLAQAPGVGGDGRREVGRELDGEGHALLLGDVAEVALEARPGARPAAAR